MSHCFYLLVLSKHFLRKNIWENLKKDQSISSLAVIILLNLMTSSLDEVRIFTVRRKLMLVSLAIKRVFSSRDRPKMPTFCDCLRQDTSFSQVGHLQLGH